MLEKILAILTILVIVFLFGASFYTCKAGAENFGAYENTRARMIEEAVR